MRGMFGRFQIACVAAAAGLGMTVTSTSVRAQSLDDVHWCLHGAADSRIDQQPMHGYCPAVAAEAVFEAIKGGTAYLPYIVGIQRDWAWKAAELSCSPDPSQQAIAVALIAACQCHNVAAANWVVGNPGPVLTKLRQEKGCKPPGR